MSAPVKLAVRAVLDALVCHGNDLAGAGDHIAFGLLQHFPGVCGTTIIVGTASEWITPALRLCRRGLGVMGKSSWRKYRERTDGEQGKHKSASRLNGSGRSECGSRHGNVPFKRASSVSLARSRNVSSQWPDRQVADMPRPAINAFSLPAFGCWADSLVGARSCCYRRYRRAGANPLQLLTRFRPGSTPGIRVSNNGRASK